MLLCCIAAAVFMFVFYARTRKPVKNALIGMGSGALSLGAAKLLSMGLGFGFTINVFTCFVSVILGIPGVISMVVLNLLFKV